MRVEISIIQKLWGGRSSPCFAIATPNPIKESANNMYVAILGVILRLLPHLLLRCFHTIPPLACKGFQ